MKYLIAFLLSVLPLAAQYVPPTTPAPTMAVMLSWDLNTETNLAGYRVLSGRASRVYTATNTVLGKVTSVVTVSNVPPGQTFFAVVAYDGSGLESDFSNEVMFSYTNRLSAPKGFRLFGTLQSSAALTGPWKDLAQVDVPLPPPVDQQQFYRSRLLLEELK